MEILKKRSLDAADSGYLECEKRWVYFLLMMSAGILGAFTYNIRGGVFCNAQTGNFVLFAMALGKGNWSNAIYYLIPMSAYLAGAIISEWLPEKVNKLHLFRWDTVLISTEIVAIIILGFIPESAPYQISQITINFICSMQYNTFRQSQRVPMATTFCTNHVRQLGIHLVMWFTDRTNKSSLQRVLVHITMLGFFVIGGIVSTVLCGYFYGKAIWSAAVLLGIILVALMHADLTKEKNKFSQKPAGH